MNETIEQKINSDNPEDIDMVNYIKEEVQNIEDERDLALAQTYFRKMELEGKKTIKFFCDLHKKRLARS